MLGRHGQYPPQLRQRAVRLVAECRADHGWEWEAMRSVAEEARHLNNGDGSQVCATERDEQLKADVARVHQANYGVYGARKIWLALNREGTPGTER